MMADGGRATPELDVIYNHVGPDGSYFTRFARAYFTDRYVCEWGQPFNFDGPDSGPVREFVLANAQYWIEEFHLDGLRVDATQQMFDASPDHALTRLRQREHVLRDGDYEGTGVSYDVDAQWLVVRRGDLHIVCNLAADDQDVPLAGADCVLLASSREPRVRGRAIHLPAESAAIVRCGES